MAENIELLFFDTFSHESSEELNLDLVQFPKPVFVSEVRIIPLGARVQADFPGGVRLGATNPSQFEIEFFVNDLSKPGASTFESLGELEYKQNGNIHLACERRASTIPTDGLVLRGWYTTITLAVYGALTKGLAETVASSQTPAPSVVPPVSVTEGSPGHTEWGGQEVPPDYVAESQEHYPGSYPPEPQYQQQEYPPSYPDQWNSSQPTGLLPPPENYETNNKDNWESSNNSTSENKMVWERSKDLKPSATTNQQGASWEWDQRHADPAFRERPPDWANNRGWRMGGRGRPRGSSWEAEEGSRKRPHTPPLEETAGPSNKWTKTSPQFNENEKEGVAFDSLSPGDVESISSEGDIPEPIVTDEVVPEIVPPSPSRDSFTPQPSSILLPSPSHISEDPEQFEPILSDEDNMEDLEAQFQDADFEDTEEPERGFDPFLELKPLEFLTGPEMCEGEVIEWRLRLHATPPSEDVAKLEELTQQWNSDVSQSEAWVDIAEQAASIVITALPYKPALLNTLIDWVQHGLNIEHAKSQPQPGYKVRHIKAGLRLALALCSCGNSALRHLLNAGLHRQLIAILRGEHMALSLRLLALRTLDASLRTQYSVQTFCEVIPTQSQSGYQFLLTLLQEAKLARLQFAITTIIRKIHLYEILSYVRDISLEITQKPEYVIEVEDKLSASLEEILHNYKDASLKIGQFRRFLPVKSQFELPNNVQDPYISIYAYMKSNQLLETILYILSTANISDNLITPVLELLNEFLNTEQGIRFLASNHVTTLAIIRALLNTGEVPDSIGSRLGIKLAYCMRVISALDILFALKYEDKLNSETTALEALRTMYCFGESLLGRLCTAHVVTRGEHIVPIMNAVTSNKGALPGRSYAMDLLINSIILVDNPSYLSKHGDEIKALISQEPRVTNLNLWLKNINNTNVQNLCEICKNLEEKAGNLPSELISALRALKHSALTRNEEMSEFVELKQRHALLELFSLDGATTLANILNKVADAFEQPALHTAAMLGPRGTRLVNLMLPALSLLRAMLSVVAHTQGASFRNMTTVPALLSSYTLLHAFPLSSPLLPLALQARSETVHALLAYTQPCSEEALPKSLWTQMLAEVLKHATSAPNTFLPGLELLSELLPLPLPMSSSVTLSEEVMARVTSLHRLWGAHLHPLASAVHETISLLGAASSPPLIALLRRVCVQLADLEPSSALMVARALLEPTVASIKADHMQGRCSALSMRRLTLLASICDYAAPKSAILHLLRNGKIDDEGPLASLCWALNKGEPSGKAQCSVAKLFSCLCDPSVAPLSGPTLPSRELLIGIVTALVQFMIDGSKYGPKALVAALQALNVIAGTEYGLFHVKTILESKEHPILPILTTSTATTPEASSLQGCVLSLINLCSDGEASQAMYVARLIGWPAAEATTHPLTTLSTSVNCPSEVPILIKSLEEIPANETWPTREMTEPTVPTVEPLASQFTLRVVTSQVAEDWSEPPSSDGTQIGALERLDLAELSAAALPDLNLSQELARLSHMHRGEEQARVAKAEGAHFQNRDRGMRRPYMTPMRSRIVFGRAMPIPRGDTFRSRPPNTSRPPSLHVDDFLALESAGQQPTGPTGYNKQTMRAKEMLVTRPRIRSRGSVSDRGGRFPSGMRLYRGDPSRGLSRGLPPNLGRGGMGDGQAPWPGEQRIRPSNPGDKMMGWGERGGPRRDVPRHPRTFSR